MSAKIINQSAKSLREDPWLFNVRQVLDDYLTKVEERNGSNAFAEAAHVLQSCAHQYGKKVDRLRVETDETFRSLNLQSIGASDNSNQTKKKNPREKKTGTSNHEGSFDWPFIPTMPESSTSILYYPYNKWKVTSPCLLKTETALSYPMEALSIHPIGQFKALKSNNSKNDIWNITDWLPSASADCFSRLNIRALSIINKRHSYVSTLPTHMKNKILTIPDELLSVQKMTDISTLPSAGHGSNTNVAPMVDALVNSFRQLKVSQGIFSASSGSVSLPLTEPLLSQDDLGLLSGSNNLWDSVETFGGYGQNNNKAHSGIRRQQQSIGRGPLGSIRRVSNAGIFQNSMRTDLCMGGPSFVRDSVRLSVGNANLSPTKTVTFSRNAPTQPPKPDRDQAPEKEKKKLRSVAALLNELKGKRITFLDPHEPDSSQPDKPADISKNVWAFPTNDFSKSMSQLTNYESLLVCMFPSTCFQWPKETQLSCGGFKSRQKTKSFFDNSQSLYFVTPEIKVSNSSAVMPDEYKEFESFLLDAKKDREMKWRKQNRSATPKNTDTSQNSSIDYSENVLVNDFEEVNDKSDREDENDFILENNNNKKNDNNENNYFEVNLDSVHHLLTSAGMKSAGPAGLLSVNKNASGRESFMTDVVGLNSTKRSTAMNSELSFELDSEEQMHKRVAAWKLKVAEWLKEVPPLFDFEVFKHNVLKKTIELNSNRKAQPFSQLVQDSSKSETCRVFLTCLFLANDFGIHLEKDEQETSDIFMPDFKIDLTKVASRSSTRSSGAGVHSVSIGRSDVR